MISNWSSAAAGWRIRAGSALLAASPGRSRGSHERCREGVGVGIPISPEPAGAGVGECRPRGMYASTRFASPRPDEEGQVSGERLSWLHLSSEFVVHHQGRTLIQAAQLPSPGGKCRGLQKLRRSPRFVISTSSKTTSCASGTGALAGRSESRGIAMQRGDAYFDAVRGDSLAEWHWILATGSRYGDRGRRGQWHVGWRRRESDGNPSSHEQTKNDVHGQDRDVEARPAKRPVLSSCHDTL